LPAEQQRAESYTTYYDGATKTKTHSKQPSAFFS